MKKKKFKNYEQQKFYYLGNRSLILTRINVIICIL